MSELKTWRQKIKHYMPASVLSQFRQFKMAVSPLALSAPVLQMYIAEQGTKSYLGINNFYSFLASATETIASLRMTFLDRDGKVICRVDEKLANFGSSFPSVSEILSRQKIVSPFGIVTVQLRPEKSRRSAYKRFGVAASHFFMFYKGRAGSVAMVHPSSTTDPENAPVGPYISNQIIATKSLAEVVLYQCNPCHTPHEMTHSLLDAVTGEVVALKTSRLSSMGTERVTFKIEEMKHIPERLKIALSALPSANSKPMLCRVYANGLFSMSHS